MLLSGDDADNVVATPSAYPLPPTRANIAFLSRIVVQNDHKEAPYVDSKGHRIQSRSVQLECHGLVLGLAFVVDLTDLVVHDMTEVKVSAWAEPELKETLQR